jgi:hypothetical protein
MADSGKLAEFTFASTVYDADDCLQSWDINDAIQDVVYQCNSLDKHAVGTRAISFAVSLALSAADTTKVSALAPGSTGAFEAHPAGDTATYIEITSTKGTVTQRNIAAPINGIIQADVVIALDDVTYQAAS